MSIVAEATRKCILPNDALNYLASHLDVERKEPVLYHKLHRAFFSLRAMFLTTGVVKLTNSEIEILKHIIASRLDGSSYCSTSDKEILREACSALSQL